MVPYVYRYGGRDILPSDLPIRRGTRIPPAVGVSYIRYHVPGLGIGGSDSGRGRARER
jgi:hypothetical protein